MLPFRFARLAHTDTQLWLWGVGWVRALFCIVHWCCTSIVRYCTATARLASFHWDPDELNFSFVPWRLYTRLKRSIVAVWTSNSTGIMYMTLPNSVSVVAKYTPPCIILLCRHVVGQAMFGFWSKMKVPCTPMSRHSSRLVLLNSKHRLVVQILQQLRISLMSHCHLMYTWQRHHLLLLSVSVLPSPCCRSTDSRRH